VAPVRINDESSVGGGGAPTTTSVVSLAETIRRRVSPVVSAREAWCEIPASASSNCSSPTR
jgi:hypothetical protein